jgi:hypothetical protein
MRPFTIFDNIQKYELSSDLHWTDDPNIPNIPEPMIPPFPPIPLPPPLDERLFDLAGIIYYHSTIMSRR